MMKRIISIMITFWAITSFAEQEWRVGDATVRWVLIREIPGSGCTGSYEVVGGTSIRELDTLGFADMAAGDEEMGFFEFFGDGTPTVNGLYWEVMWPPNVISQDMLYGERNKWHFIECSGGGFCNSDGFEPPDTGYLADGFGLCWNDHNQPSGIWGINRAVKTMAIHPHIMTAVPCPPGGDPGSKLELYFADSTYMLTLAPYEVLSCNSPLYLEAITFYQPEKITAGISLRHHPERAISIDLVPDVAGDTLYKGKLDGDSTLALGLEYFDNVRAVAELYGDSAKARIWVCRPWVLNSPDNVFIRSDSMKIRDDLTVSLTIVDDSSRRFVSPPELIDTVGYKYKSKWTANANRPQDSTYYRQYPPGNDYKKWNKAAGNCAVIFDRDSLYVVGGDLTIEAKGALKHIDKIDNSFLRTTDIIYRGDSIPTRRIWIDKDPANSAFMTYFTRDRIRAVAWKEWAGYGDPDNCGNTQWNHYLDDKISGADTCYGSKTPCENSQSTATGIMQFLRGDWEGIFNGSKSAPPGNFHICSWDSLAWNWKYCIDNGAYIHDTYKPIKAFLPIQRTFADSCPYSSCGDFPGKKNQEDLKSYAYTATIAKLHLVIDDESWKSTIGRTTPPISREAQYVQDVRHYVYYPPW